MEGQTESASAPQHQWTVERVAELTRLWASGLSASEIGRRLGITKNAVIGKARRIDLAMRRAPAQVPRKARILTLERLNSNMCSWPDGDPGEPDFRFCGKPTVDGKPYCANHCSLAYLAPNKGKKEVAAA
jgi:GcrA cell cycle regulator